MNRTCAAVKANGEVCGKAEKRTGRFNVPLCGTHARAAEARGEGTWLPRRFNITTL